MDGCRILMVVTSHDRIDAEHPTGLWLEEFAVPYTEFRNAGCEVTVASTRGGAVPIDPRSKPAPEQERAWQEARAVLQTTHPIQDIAANGFDAIFLPGGHGTMFDLPGNASLQRILAEMDRRGSVLAAVCHGPAGFIHVRKADNTPLVEGRRITAFTNEEEREVGLAWAMPFLLESKLEEEGAQFVARANWADHVEEDGNLITGQNPQSSGSAAHAVLHALGRDTTQRAAA